jgi:hypothetical protein
LIFSKHFENGESSRLALAAGNRQFAAPGFLMALRYRLPLQVQEGLLRIAQEALRSPRRIWLLA